MKCIKCGAYVYNSDKFCRNCGTTINSDGCKYGDNIENSKFDESSCHETQFQYSYQYSNKEKPTYDMNATHEQQYNYWYDKTKYDYAYKPNDSGGDKFVKAYIGLNYEKISNNKFSIPSLIFGPLYFLYRKINNYALAAIILIIAATYLLGSDITWLAILTTNIIFAFNFKSIYMKQAEDKVEMIKQQGLDKTTDELLTICKRKGGVNIKLPIVLIMLLPLINADFYEYKKDTTKPQEEQEQVLEEINANIDNLYYTLPIGYTQSINYDNQKIYKYYIYQMNCGVKFETIAPVGNAYNEETYLSSYIDTTSTLHSIKYNDHEWKYRMYLLDGQGITVYAKKYNNKLYLVTFENTHFSNCNEKFNKILPTLQFK